MGSTKSPHKYRKSEYDCICVGTMALCLRVGSIVGMEGDSSEDKKDLFLSASILLSMFLYAGTTGEAKQYS